MKIDLHVHTSGISLCGHVSPEETLRLYGTTDYDGLVITNHYSRYIVRHHTERTGRDFFDLYQEEFHTAEEAGKKYGKKVFCGYELRFDGSDNDYLVYGLPEDLARKYDALFSMTPEEFGAVAKERGFLFYQAHPFRNGMKIIRPDALSGIEIKNGHPRHDSRNDVAVLWAQKYHLHGIGGSDFHQKQDLGTSGILTDQKVDSLEDLLEVLRKDLYTVF